MVVNRSANEPAGGAPSAAAAAVRDDVGLIERTQNLDLRELT